MKYGLVEIKPAGFKNKTYTEWKCGFSFDDEERKRGPEVCSSLGFHYFPGKSSKEKAFLKLKNLLVNEHERKIANLTLSLKKLKKLKCPKA